MRIRDSFPVRVLRSFRANQGLLLSGAVAYYTLLSIIPLLILALIVLSHIIPEDRLLQTIETYMDMVMPSYASKMTDQATVFLEHRQVIGIIGGLVLLFFSSLSFTALENAMSVIFYHRVRIQRRHFLISAIIPYVYICSLALGMLVVSFIAGALVAFENREILIFGLHLSVGGAAAAALYVLGLIGEVLMLSSLYIVMPVGGITLKYALIGGVSATILWEITRRVLVWYYSTLSLVNVIYGPFATAVVTLLSIEAAAVILLFGAQVIAELDRDVRKSVGQKGGKFRT